MPLGLEPEGLFLRTISEPVREARRSKTIARNGHHWIGPLGFRRPILVADIGHVGWNGWTSKNGIPVMKRYLPGRVELVLFATLAVICAMISGTAVERDTAMSLLAFPVFVFAAVMGLWRSGKLRSPAPERAVAPSKITDDQIA